jgi:hypothetical protein
MAAEGGDGSFRVGLLGHGTVGSAFEALLQERAAQVESITGLHPRITGVLTSSRGDFDEILARSDLVVEVMGGLEPARDYVLRAMAAAATSSPPTSSCSAITARSCGRRPVSTGSSCASRRPWRASSR